MNDERLRRVWNAYLLLCVMLVMSVTAIAQKATVTGNVTSADDGSGLPGVSVIIKGTSKGTVTNIDGNYSIEAEENDILVFSFIGMKQVEHLANASVIDVRLEPDTKLLEEVVKIGYGEQTKKVISGAVASVDGEEVREFVTSDLGNALQGRVAGVNVTSQSGAPGANSSITIRGLTTISGSNEPLYVVDGVPQDGNPRLAPSEIESIDILKDASSAAVYGARGAAGVILITTRQPEEGNMTVNLQATYGVKKINESVFVPTMSTAEQYQFIENANLYDRSANNPLTGLQGTLWASNETDLKKLILNDYAPTQNYNVNLSGGSRHIGYNVTLGMYDNEGSIFNSGFRRYNTRFTTRYNKGKWNVMASAAYASEQQNQIVGNLLIWATQYKPFLPLVDYRTDVVEWDSSTGNTDARDRQSNFLSALRRDLDLTRERFNGSVNIGYDIGYGFSSNTVFGVSTTNRISRWFEPPIYQQDIETGAIVTEPSQSEVSRLTQRMTTRNINSALSYNKKVEGHTFTITGVVDIDQRTNETFYATVDGVNNSLIRTFDNASGTSQVWSSAAPASDDYRINMASFVGRLEYNYKQKYNLMALVRRDGSSNFSEENRWGTFNSFSASWNVADEEFWSALSSVSDNFKLRAGYGELGNERIRPYSYSPTINTVNLDYPFGASNLQPGAVSEGYANDQVKWETSITTNVGTDIGLFKNKFLFSADYFWRTNEDMLFPVVIPLSAGAYNTDPGGAAGNNIVIQNVGSMENKGIELVLTYRDRVGDFSWNLNGTFTRMRNKMTKLSGDTEVAPLSGSTVPGNSDLLSVLALGHEAGSYWVYKTDGLVRTEEQLAEQQEINPDDVDFGSRILVDVNEDGTIDSNDLTYGGSAMPDYEVGLNVDLKWRQFDFTMNWYASVGHEVFNGGKAYAYSRGVHKDLLYTYSPENPDFDVPPYADFRTSNYNYRYALDTWIEDASFLRLRTVTLGYTVPNKIVQKVNVRRLRVFISAQNALTFTNYDGFNPEVAGVPDSGGNNQLATRGLDRANYPISALYMGGIQLNF
ncbi:SusC/RagA family TonB-linked outer membrane protein [Reichenbachiella versicolor]|uniref:SusC/RagA family TonB-linked outer membrane protein n=1 Tax=Reichenbachiella versicolor TaxID=1821036 RepID=UPI000D6E0C51|nr:TonB-dependent receptor [Reichenbachiella versicolor]